MTFTLGQQLTVIAVCALTAYVAQRAVAVFNDGVRPFLLDFVRGRSTRGAVATVSFGLSAGFVFGLGAPLALATGVLNPWLLFLPTDVLGLLSPKRWLAALSGAAWGAVVVFGLAGANRLAHKLPVDFVTAMQQMATPILYLFTLFPVLAVTRQFGRLSGAVCGVIELALVVTALKLWPKAFPGSVAMAAGVLLLTGLAVHRDLVQRRRADRGRAATKQEPRADRNSDAAPMTGLFRAGATRLRAHLALFMLLGAGMCLLASTHVYAGGEAGAFLIADGRYGAAAQVDFYRALGFIPLIATTALASGAYGVAGFTLVHPVGYLLPGPWPAAAAGAATLAAEVTALSWAGRALGGLPSVRDSSEHLRCAIAQTLDLALLFGSLTAANAMAGGLGILLAGGLYLSNEAMGRPVARMAAAPAAVISAGVVLNVLSWLHLFTPAPR
ncbi:YhfT family protein [Streptosporangium nondiastaticum]|uniref:YhfT family protein n=1 Tax=Streptosporangium nondiastaticum TaxID=35764 RepID=UPI001CB9C7B7|nr:YhfT family protein [Streptosporangium nondiastaticum]